LTASCPNCGASLTFQVGHSRAAVCEFCHALVSRKGQDFEAVGKVADLIPTGSRLSRGMEGKIGEHRFTLVGRLQYQWDQGAWDEWYASVDDGRWGWLAEAQGRYYLTFPDHAPDVPPEQALGPGASFLHPKYGSFSFTDRKRARIAGVEGEVPDAIAVGEESLTADFEGPKGLFATVDYSEGSERRFFLGRQVTLKQLSLKAGEPRPLPGRAKAGAGPKCPNCHAPVELLVPDQAVRAVCGSCGAVLDTTKGELRVLEVLRKHNSVPPIPLGTQGTLRGRKVQVVGWMRRSCIVDGVTYDWQELLLYEAGTTGFLWLVLTDGHWQLAEPISAGEVQAELNARNDGVNYKLFSSVTGVVEEVLGEFYWAVAVGDRAQLSDYIRPPKGLSSESTDTEVNWSLVSHLEAAELAQAFRKPGLTAEPPSGVGTVQPYPYDQAGSALMGWMGFAALAVLGLGLLFVARGRTLIYEHRFTAAELFVPGQTMTLQRPPGAPPGVTLPGPAQGPHHYAFLSERFHVPALRAVEVELTTDVDNHWAYADGALIPAQSGPSPVFGLEASYYHGYSGGESWSEGGRSASAAVSAPAAGDYVLRADLQWDPKLTSPPGMELKVYSGGYSGWQFLLALLALAGPALLLIFHRSAFEKQRWENSNLVGED
jgi:hypothetical protein